MFSLANINERIISLIKSIKDLKERVITTKKQLLTLCHCSDPDVVVHDTNVMEAGYDGVTTDGSYTRCDNRATS